MGAIPKRGIPVSGRIVRMVKFVAHFFPPHPSRKPDLRNGCSPTITAGTSHEFPSRRTCPISSCRCKRNSRVWDAGMNADKITSHPFFIFSPRELQSPWERGHLACARQRTQGQARCLRSQRYPQFLSLLNNAVLLIFSPARLQGLHGFYKLSICLFLFFRNRYNTEKSCT